MGNGGLVDFEFGIVQNMFNHTDSSQQDQLNAHQTHQGRDQDHIDLGLAGIVKNAALSENQGRSEIFGHVHAFAQSLVEKGSSVVNVTSGFQGDAAQTFAKQNFAGGGAIDSGINP
ncbi:hypothetical protein SAMN04489729_7173 [Amycolatopsis lurida]|uniref:Uncharacterized protein n=1 Tax=Amycolatopsis lurida NRRL 2430 TaxID=1460371 RepID=A0A2P2FJ92_AMYLU|nr:hypothetical protein [Amycolatopsis lurida]KFU76786.1 hypothetical protein BB31_33960 [Amycolatopsis lurida NRRL 2430]SEE34547.1 hypothetical protein SAMN04489729_7173 [Amycolatopsis lurida]